MTAFPWSWRGAAASVWAVVALLVAPSATAAASATTPTAAAAGENFVDPLLPGFHFVPWPFDWMNDPNGPFYDPVHKKYHIFYQYQTPRQWGHAISDDLVSWQQLPMALTRKRTYDSGGDYSGSATVLDDAARTPLLTVSSSTSDVIWLAIPCDRSDPMLICWKYVDTAEDVPESIRALRKNSPPLPPPAGKATEETQAERLQRNQQADGSELVNPIFRTRARDPTEIWRNSATGHYEMAVGTERGVVVWEAPSLSDVFSRRWTPRFPEGAANAAESAAAGYAKTRAANGGKAATASLRGGTAAGLASASASSSSASDGFYDANRDGFVNYVECPDFFPLPPATTTSNPAAAAAAGTAPYLSSSSSSSSSSSDGLWVLKVSRSPIKGDFWATGHYDAANGTFRRVTPYGPVDSNAHFFAGKTMFDPTHGQRRVLFTWLMGVKGSPPPGQAIGFGRRRRDLGSKSNNNGQASSRAPLSRSRHSQMPAGTARWLSALGVPRVVQAAWKDGVTPLSFPIPELAAQLRKKRAMLRASGLQLPPAAGTPLPLLPAAAPSSSSPSSSSAALSAPSGLDEDGVFVQSLDIRGQMLDIEATIAFYGPPEAATISGAGGGTATTTMDTFRVACGVRVLWADGSSPKLPTKSAPSSSSSSSSSSSFMDVLIEVTAPVAAAAAGGGALGQAYAANKSLVLSRNRAGVAKHTKPDSHAPVPGEAVTGVVEQYLAQPDVQKSDSNSSGSGSGSGSGSSGKSSPVTVAKLRVLVDKAIIEAFADGGAASTFHHARHLEVLNGAAMQQQQQGGGARAGGATSSRASGSARAGSVAAASAASAGVAGGKPPASASASAVGAVFVEGGVPDMGKSRGLPGGRCEFLQLDVYPMQRFNYDTAKCEKDAAAGGCGNAVAAAAVGTAGFHDAAAAAA